MSGGPSRWPGRKKWPGQRREAEPAGHVPLYSSSVELRSPEVAELLRAGFGECEGGQVEEVCTMPMGVDVAC